MNIKRCDRCGAEKIVAKEGNDLLPPKSEDHGDVCILARNSILTIQDTQINFGDLCVKCWNHLTKDLEQFARNFVNYPKDTGAKK